MSSHDYLRVIDCNPGGGDTADIDFLAQFFKMLLLDCKWNINISIPFLNILIVITYVQRNLIYALITKKILSKISLRKRRRRENPSWDIAEEESSSRSRTSKRLQSQECIFFKFYIIYLNVTLLFSRLLSKNLKIKIYKTVILPVVLYSCETWSLILREECRLRVFENRILKRIFGL